MLLIIKQMQYKYKIFKPFCLKFSSKQIKSTELQKTLKHDACNGKRREPFRYFFLKFNCTTKIKKILRIQILLHLSSHHVQ